MTKWNYFRNTSLVPYSKINISFKTEKVFDKIQHLFIKKKKKKTLSQLVTEGNYLKG